MPQTQTRAVVVATSAMARLYIRDLVAELVRQPRDVKVLSYFPGRLFDDGTEAAIAEQGAEIRQYGPATNFQRLRDRRSAHRQLHRWLGEGPTDLFHVHPNQFLTNWISFDAARRETLKVRLNLIPDGLANYYVAYLNANDRPGLSARLSNLALRIPYHPRAGTVLGLESLDYHSYWYVGSPGVMGEYMPTRRFEVERPVMAEPARPDTWLFLGQPGNGERFTSVYQRLLTAVIAASKGRAHYKQHPFEQLSAESVASLEAMGFVVVDSQLPGEHLGLSYAAVSGVLSSALVNLRVLGWHDAVYGVLDAGDLATLTGRSPAEMEQIAAAASMLGIRPILASTEPSTPAPNRK